MRSFMGQLRMCFTFQTTQRHAALTEGTATNTNIGTPVSATHWANEDAGTSNDVTLEYSLEGTDATSFSIVSGTGQLKTQAALDYDIKNSYSVTVKVEEKDGTTVRSDDTIDVTITVNEAGAPPPPPPPSPLPPVDTTPVVEADSETPRKRRIIYDCPIGWVRSDGFAGRNRRVLLYEVKLEMDISNPISIYKPVWVAIYVHPDEGLENLDGWKLQVAIPYNHHREYPLTAENSVVVDAGFVEGGFAFIENIEENPFPMTGIGFTGSPAPGFDYRLYDDTGRRVDFGISCYKRGDIFQVLKEMEDPRVLRKVLLETLNWDAHYLRSEWTVPVPVNVQGAPSLQGVNLVGKWADLKKQ